MNSSNQSSNFNYPDSYYAASVNDAPERPPLDGDIDAEICVIGAGYSGLSAAIYVGEQGHKVVVLEQGQVG